MKKAFQKIAPQVRVSSELLGLSPGAAPAELKKAYHKLALLYHPDRNPGVDAAGAADVAVEFRKVTDAYELLSDPLRVDELNRKYVSARFQAQVVEGFNVTFGSFFGYRVFNASAAGASLLRLGSRAVAKESPNESPNEKTGDSLRNAGLWPPVEENNSILDHPAFDAIEVVYAGKLSARDEAAVKGEVDAKKLVQLPWVLLNNEGLLKFLDGDLKRSGECYRKLCERVPNNIIFMYRYGLCLILEGFQKPRRTLLGTLKPDRLKIERGLALLQHCIKIGETRTVGRQKCLVIRKIVADVQERLGHRRRAKSLWKAILDVDPTGLKRHFG